MKHIIVAPTISAANQLARDIMLSRRDVIAVTPRTGDRPLRGLSCPLTVHVMAACPPIPWLDESLSIIAATGHPVHMCRHHW